MAPKNICAIAETFKPEMHLQGLAYVEYTVLISAT